MSNYTKVSIIIPAYNEKNTIREIVERTKKANVLGLEKEIIVVDNFSTDGTREIMQELGRDPMVKIILHDRNEGVGKSWRDGMFAASGQILIRQDADLEYQPEDFPLILKPILEGKAKIVFGSRILGQKKNIYQYKTYLWGGLLINKIFNIVLRINLSDVLTASKSFEKSILDSFSLECDHFEMESEFVAKATRAGYTIKEVPITYRARSFAEGKKIRWYHAYRILITLLWYRFAALS